MRKMKATQNFQSQIQTKRSKQVKQVEVIFVELAITLGEDKLLQTLNVPFLVTAERNQIKLF